MKQIYILLSKTKTIPARVIYRLKGGPFTHSSISFLPSTEHFYSYARRKPNNIFVGGLIEENLHMGTFARYANCNCALYSLSVSDEDYEKMKQSVDFYMKNYKKASYNMLGIFLLGLGIRWRRKFKLTCSQFVACILSSVEGLSLPKDPYLMCPNDFMQIKELSLLYTGTLQNCTQESFNQQAKV